MGTSHAPKEPRKSSSVAGGVKNKKPPIQKQGSDDLLPKPKVTGSMGGAFDALGRTPNTDQGESQQDEILIAGNEWYPGKVTFHGTGVDRNVDADLVRRNFAVIFPQDGQGLLQIPEVGVEYECDGFWMRGTQNQWYKIPNRCWATVGIYEAFWLDRGFDIMIKPAAGPVAQAAGKFPGWVAPPAPEGASYPGYWNE